MMKVFGENTFFEIPIYRCDVEKHSTLMKARIEKNADNRGVLTRIALDESGATYTFWYNEIIGCICLYILGNQLRGEYYMDSSKRKHCGIRKKNFKNKGKAFELHINQEMTSKGIFDELINEIQRINKHDFRGRFIDTEALINSGKYIDWKLLVADLNMFKEMKEE